MTDLRPVDSIEILILTDNYVDVLLPGTTHAERPLPAKDGMILAETPIAEHGLSLLITARADDQTHSVLLDAGYNPATVKHNLRVLGLDLSGVETVVVSHGHMDHTGGLLSILAEFPTPPTLITHPTAYATRYLTLPTGLRIQFPTVLKRADLDRLGVNVIESAAPLTIAGDTMLVTGQIPRETSFEKGMPGAVMESDEGFEPDPIEDDQSIALNVKGRGLVVVSGCAHAGIINSVRYAQRLTGESRVHAVVGGFHLTGPVMEQIIDPTIKEMKKLDPDVIVPMHCTGSTAIQRFAGEFPDRFILSSVGTKLMFSA